MNKCTCLLGAYLSGNEALLAKTANDLAELKTMKQSLAVCNVVEDVLWDIGISDRPQHWGCYVQAAWWKGDEALCQAGDGAAGWRGTHGDLEHQR